MPNPATHDPDQVWVVADTETTSLDVSKGERIVTLAAIKATFSKEIDSLYLVLDTEGRHSSPEALAIHQIKIDDTRQIPEADALRQFIPFVGNLPLIFHNAPFDMGFLRDAFARRGIAMPDWQIIDTVVEARKRLPGKSSKLDVLARHYNIDAGIMGHRKERHDALEDCRITLAVWKAMNMPEDLLGAGLPGEPEPHLATRASVIPAAAMPDIELDW
ncbi:MAG: 3'-5' exonuclease [Beijerinckiaceae bacterium]|nr:MAG: 3'-5' exonuclease [Beijerinckiaceae bacterium]